MLPNVHKVQFESLLFPQLTTDSVCFNKKSRSKDNKKIKHTIPLFSEDRSPQ